MEESGELGDLEVGVESVGKEGGAGVGRGGGGGGTRLDGRLGESQGDGEGKEEEKGMHLKCGIERERGLGD